MADFDSKQYSWAEVSVAVGGRIITGIQSVEYTVKQDKELLYGRGNEAHGITRGNKSGEGKISVWQSELEAMTESAPDKDILKLQFDQVISYTGEDGGKTVTDILKTCEITEYKKGMSQGDKNMLVELPYIFTKLKPQE